MAVFVVAAVLLANAGSARAQSPPQTSFERAATEFVQHLGAGRFDLAAAAVDSSVAAQLPASLLADLWRALAQTGGAITSVTARETGVTSGYHLVAVEAQLERGAAALRLSFTANGRVVGVFRAQPAPPRWTPPAYADTAAIREIELSVGDDPWRLPATLTLPRTGGRVPVVVLVHGSGPNDRDETSPGGSRLFKDIAWGLASRGIAVLRYDKRTLVYRGRLSARDVTVEDEVLADALAALRAARAQPGIDSTRVFLIGHSLGAMLAPEIGVRDGRLAGVIMLAGTPRPLSRVIVDQLEYLATLGQPRDAHLLDQLAALSARRIEPDSLVMGAPARYWYDLDARDPIARATELRAPMFLLQGGRDYQVTMADFALWQRALRGRPATTFSEYATLNHYFVAGVGMATPSEYATSNGHASMAMIEDLARWMLGR
jgi:hypothetical protein